MNCLICEDKRYTNMVSNSDGSFTYSPCECTGITSESLKAFCKAIEGRDLIVEGDGDVQDIH